jgi:hypothetical protein
MTEANVQEPQVNPNEGMPAGIDLSYPTFPSYIERTRAYYLAAGYDNPYKWAHFQHVPFAPVTKPLAESRIGLVTTAINFDPAKGEQGVDTPYDLDAKTHAVFSGPTDSIPDLRISHLGYDRTSAEVEDINAYFPLLRLQEAAAAGRIGALAEQFHGVPTVRGQRKTIERDAPVILERMRAAEVDAAILVGI